MKCDTAQQNMILAGYGELHDEQIDGLEEHLAQCEDCRREFEALKAFEATLAFHPNILSINIPKGESTYLDIEHIYIP